MGRGSYIQGLAAVVAASFLWSTNMLMGKLLVETMPPFTLSFLRQTVCLFAVLPFALVHWRTIRPAAAGRLPELAGLGLLAFALPHTLIYLALQRTSAINVGLLNALLPAIALGFALLVIRTAPTGFQLLGVLVSGLGAVVIVTGGDVARALALSFGSGELLGLAAMTSAALYTVLIGASKRVPPIAVLLSVGAAAGVVVLFPPMLVELAYTDSIRLTPAVALGVVYLGIFPSAVALVAWNRGIVLLTPGLASQGVHLIPLFTVVLAVTLLGEVLMPFHLVAFALVVAGIALARLHFRN